MSRAECHEERGHLPWHATDAGVYGRPQASVPPLPAPHPPRATSVLTTGQRYPLCSDQRRVASFLRIRSSDTNARTPTIAKRHRATKPKLETPNSGVNEKESILTEFAYFNQKNKALSSKGVEQIHRTSTEVRA